jgi:dATP pyrophosphohydrolase
LKFRSNLVETHIFKRYGKEIRFLLLKRNIDQEYGGIWQMVNGKIKNGEKAFETAIREIKEETGLTIKKLWIVPNVNYFYSHEDDSIILIPVFVAEANPKLKVKLSSEHQKMKWVSAKKAKKMLIWEGQRKSVDLICQYLYQEGKALKLNEIDF